jgi:uncharacterized protein
MATAMAGTTASAIRGTRWTSLLAYLAAVIVAEVLIAVPGGPAGEDRPFQPIGLGVHLLLVFSLLFLSVLMHSRDGTLASLLVASSLASLVRVFSLATPRFAFIANTPAADPQNTVPWLALVSIPLLASVLAFAYVQGLRPRDLQLYVVRWKDIPWQTAIALTGLPLGFLEFAILRPEAWIPAPTLAAVLVGALVIFLATGLSEELVFRGILLKRAVQGLGERAGLLYVTAIFASLHIFFLNGVDLVFVFLVGLFYGFAVLKTKNLWGVILSHSLGNVILYLVAPFLGV